MSEYQVGDLVMFTKEATDPRMWPHLAGKLFYVRKLEDERYLMLTFAEDGRQLKGQETAPAGESKTYVHEGWTGWHPDWLEPVPPFMRRVQEILNADNPKPAIAKTKGRGLGKNKTKQATARSTRVK